MRSSTPASSDWILEASLPVNDLRNILLSMKDLNIPHAKLHFSSTGLQILHLEPLHIALIEALLPSSAFDYLLCPHPIDIGINVPSILNIIRRCSTSDSGSLVLLVEDPTHMLYLQWEDHSNDLYAEFGIKTIQIEPDALGGIPSTVQDCEFTMPSQAFMQICKEHLPMLQYHDMNGRVARIRPSQEPIRITADRANSRLILASKGGSHTSTVCPVENESASVEMVYNHDDDAAEEYRCAAYYNSKYLAVIARACAAPVVTVSFSDRQPILVEYHLQQGYLKLCLAPQLEKYADEEADL